MYRIYDLMESVNTNINFVIFPMKSCIYFAFFLYNTKKAML